tara:strand:+ start:3760 stop:4371 length:612 start_codon:yes stop_codon:yes gene_type:complete
MKIIITENQKHLLRLVLFFSEIVELKIADYEQQKKDMSWCKYYDEDSFVNKFFNMSLDDFINDQWHFFHDDTEKGGSTMDFDLLYKYARRNYTDQIRDLYRRKCGNSLNESKINFARRLPAIEEELNRLLEIVNPTEFYAFQDYISFLASITLTHLGNEDDFKLGWIPGEKHDLYTEFRDYIIYGLRKDIRKIYDSGKPGGLF